MKPATKSSKDLAAGAGLQDGTSRVSCVVFGVGRRRRRESPCLRIVNPTILTPIPTILI